MSTEFEMPRELRTAICQTALDDVDALEHAHKSYGESWKKRGGVGAYMMLARKWDRIENQLQQHPLQYNILEAGFVELLAGIDNGIMDDIRDLRRYLNLVETEIRARYEATGVEDAPVDAVEEEGAPTRGYVAQG